MHQTKISPETIKNAFDPERISFLIDTFAGIGRDESGGITRLAFSREDLKAREAFLRLLEAELNVKIHMDALGNIFARREGIHPDWPAIMTGSHLDSVRNGGKFDGPAGVFSAFEAFRVLDQLNIETEHPFVLTMFTSEEPNTFGISTFGSRGLAGKLDRAQLENLRDDAGNDFKTALASIGGDLDRIQDAVLDPATIKYFLEIHIEQMPFLERAHKDIGVVKGVTGIYRERISVRGVASHCGTTPMDERRDALCAASEIILALETAARKEKEKAVATIGHLNVFPNSINITPERVEMDAEIRSYYSDSIRRITDTLNDTASQIQKRRSIRIDREVLYETGPTTFSPDVRKAIRDAAALLGLDTLDLISMAGHDAAHMNDVAQSGMIFIPCKGGLSHCPEEWTDIKDLVKGAQCLLQTLLLLDTK
ncbi:MAG: M20 family metallo-hydrolase [Deltaproteobacteria bacterium]|nr:M20 family metallo-hydrolase [Deltaproteobacteria bacterium]MBW2017520.1 M20 family metallo-hydrolase [Deltaproteobacteria bacterium]MBW2130235.1 M20 family metallo-hydrolase [Deltaproteobacteria bacterium]MBW2304776.1 M20 family metallo-hydrolase [Deltaproteobacteria bacterium]